MKNWDYEIIVADVHDTSEVPKDKDIYYRCKSCGGIIPSLPKDNVGCQCGNVFIDIDYWRLAVDDYSLFEVIKKK